MHGREVIKRGICGSGVENFSCIASFSQPVRVWSVCYVYERTYLTGTSDCRTWNFEHWDNAGCKLRDFTSNGEQAIDVMEKYEPI